MGYLGPKDQGRGSQGGVDERGSYEEVDVE